MCEVISKEQIERVERECAANSSAAFGLAKEAEQSLEAYTYTTERPYDPVKRQWLLYEFNEADYQAESRAWLLNLIRAAKNCE